MTTPEPEAEAEADSGDVTLDSTRPVNERTTLHTVDVEPMPAGEPETAESARARLRAAGEVAGGEA